MAAPTVTSVTPSTGVPAGGEVVLIVGTGFSAATAVEFGGVTANDYAISSATLIAAVTPCHAEGTAKVVVTNADGSSTDAVNFTYSSSTGLFTVAELRAFYQNTLPVTVTDSDIISAEQRVREQFEDICDVAFVSTSKSKYFDGSGTDELLLDECEVTAVTACVIYDSSGTATETFDATDLTDLAIYPEGKIIRKTQGEFLEGDRNVYVTFTHGYTSVPKDIARAAMIVALNELTFSNISDRTTSYSDGVMNYQLATAGMRGAWYGIPLVDTVLKRHDRTIPALR